MYVSAPPGVPPPLPVIPVRAEPSPANEPEKDPLKVDPLKLFPSAAAPSGVGSVPQI